MVYSMFSESDYSNEIEVAIYSGKMKKIFVEVCDWNLNM